MTDLSDIPTDELVAEIRRRRKAPDQLKRDNWQLYVLARSNDPSVMIPNTRKLISNLLQTEQSLGDYTHHKDIAECIRIVNDAWYEYSENKAWGYAMQECEKILDKIGILLYDDEWVIMQKDSYVGMPIKKV